MVLGETELSVLLLCGLENRTQLRKNIFLSRFYFALKVRRHEILHGWWRDFGQKYAFKDESSLTMHY